MWGVAFEPKKNLCHKCSTILNHGVNNSGRASSRYSYTASLHIELEVVAKGCQFLECDVVGRLARRKPKSLFLFLLLRVFR